MANKHKDLKEVLRDNVAELARQRYGRFNLSKLASDAKIGLASAQRIKEAKTSVGIDIVEKVAKVFRIEAYQLLCQQTFQESFLLVCEAYSSADERGRMYLVSTAEAVLRTARAELASKAHG